MNPLINKFKEYGNLPPEIENDLTKYIKTRTKQKSEFFLKQGQILSSLFIIETGLVRSYYIKDDIAPYVTTKPIHPSQKPKADSSGLEDRINVIPNFELEKLILSFGEQVKVISPQDFKEQISNRLKPANELY